jgi:hypothetical protein
MENITILKSGQEFVTIKKMTDKNNGTTDVEIEYSEEFAKEAESRSINKAKGLEVLMEEVINKATLKEDNYEIKN